MAELGYKQLSPTVPLRSMRTFQPARTVRKSRHPMATAKGSIKASIQRFGPAGRGGYVAHAASRRVSESTVAAIGPRLRCRDCVRLGACRQGSGESERM